MTISFMCESQILRNMYTCKCLHIACLSTSRSIKENHIGDSSDVT